MEGENLHCATPGRMSLIVVGAITTAVGGKLPTQRWTVGKEVCLTLSFLALVMFVRGSLIVTSKRKQGLDDYSMWIAWVCWKYSSYMHEVKSQC
jgi:hypothetical protein